MRRISMIVVAVVLGGGVCVFGSGAARASGHAPSPPPPHGTVLASLSDPGGTAGDSFGNSVAVDGTTAVVGAYATNFQQGAVYIYAKGASAWPTSPTVTLHDPNVSTGDLFGNSVAIDGTTIVVGSDGYNAGEGLVYVYVKGSNGWPKKPTLTLHDPGNTQFDFFGSSVATAEGRNIVVGSAAAYPGAGSAYIYTKGTTGWPKKPTATLADPAATAGDSFGGAVAVSATTAVVGAYNGDAAYVYVKGSSGWPTSPTTSLADPGGQSYDFFGFSVAIDESSTIVVGANSTNTVGAAYIYSRGTSGWPSTPTTTLADPPQTTNDDFGYAVAVDGSNLVVGSDGPPSFFGIDQMDGAVYYFTKGPGGWSTTPTTTVADPQAMPGDRFGTAVSVETGAVVVGAFGTFSSQIGGIGAAYVLAP